LTISLWSDDSIWFVAQTDGDFVFVIKFVKDQDSEVSGTQRISLQYNNKFKLPVGTKQEDIRKINGYDIRIMRTPGNYDESKSIVLIERNRQLKRILKSSGGDPKGFSFPYPDHITKTDRADSRREISLIKNTPDKTGDGIPDVMIQYFSGGAHCCFEMYFINLGETVQTVDILGMADGQDYLPVSKSPNGGLLFHTYDIWAYWNTSFAHSPGAAVILKFKNGKLRPSFDLMKKPAPSFALLKNKAEFYRQKLSLAPYTGEENTHQPPDFKDPFYKEDSYPNNGNEKYKGTIYRNVVFWGPMLDLIYTGHEDLAWQFLDVVWPPQKQGKALFIRDFNKQLLESAYRQMVLEGQREEVPTTKSHESTLGISTPMARFQFNGEARNEGNGKGQCSLANTQFRETESGVRALYLNGIPDERIYARITGVTGGYRTICPTPELNYSKWSVAVRFKAQDFGGGVGAGVKDTILVGGVAYRWFALTRDHVSRSLTVTFNNGEFIRAIPSTSLTLNAWTVVACGFDLGARKLVVYLDGNKVAQLDLPSNFKLDIIGSDFEKTDKEWTFTNYGRGGVFHGLVSDLIVYDRLLSEKEFVIIPLKY